jgi:hypothetical protein
VTERDDRPYAGGALERLRRRVHPEDAVAGGALGDGPEVGRVGLLSNSSTRYRSRSVLAPATP